MKREAVDAAFIRTTTVKREVVVLFSIIHMSTEVNRRSIVVLCCDGKGTKPKAGGSGRAGGRVVWDA
jgi:hypothetical protein